MNKTYRFHRVQLVRRPLEEAFGFFADVENLKKITPDSLHFKFITPVPVEMRPGMEIEYHLQVYGIGCHWRTRIESYDPPHRFSDTQQRGPYKRWYHVHEFIPVPEGTLVVDRVEYELRWGLFGSLANRLFVRSSLEKIFNYRFERVDKLLNQSLALQGDLVSGR